MAQAYPDLQSAGAEFLGIGRFTTESATQTRSSNNLPFPLCADPSGEVVDRYSGTAPSSMLMARTGTYVIGRDGRVTFMRVEQGGTAAPTVDEILEAVRNAG